LKALAEQWNIDRDNFDNPQQLAKYSIALHYNKKAGLRYKGKRELVDFHSNALSSGKNADLYKKISGGKLIKPQRKQTNPNKIQSRKQKRYFALWRLLLTKAAKMEENESIKIVLESLSHSDKLVFIKDFFVSGKIRINDDFAELPQHYCRLTAESCYKAFPRLAFLLSNIVPGLELIEQYKGFSIVRDVPKVSPFVQFAQKQLGFSESYSPRGFYVHIIPMIKSLREKYYDLENISKPEKLVYYPSIEPAYKPKPLASLEVTLAHVHEANQAVINAAGFVPAFHWLESPYAYLTEKDSTEKHKKHVFAYYQYEPEKVKTLVRYRDMCRYTAKYNDHTMQGLAVTINPYFYRIGELLADMHDKNQAYINRMYNSVPFDN
jgi:hypothetical protein